MPVSTPLTVDALLDIVKREAARRERNGSGDAVTGPGFAARISTMPAATFAPGYLVRTPRRHVRDFLPLLGEEFLQEAFRTLLWRPADEAAREIYLGALACGRASRWEILARIRFSPEGRKKQVQVRWLLLTGLVSAGYRIPLMGPLAAALAHVMALPEYLRDTRRSDARAFALLRSLGR